MCQGESILKAGARLSIEVTFLCSPIYTGRCVSVPYLTIFGAVLFLALNVLAALC